MLKSYNLNYNKLQNNSIFDNTLIFFQNWSNLNNNYFRHTIFIYFYSCFFINLNFFSNLSKYFSNSFNKSNLFFYFFCNPNFLIHENSNNSRMGNGNGTPNIWVYNPILNSPVIILGNLNNSRAYNILSYLNNNLNNYMFVSFV